MTRLPTNLRSLSMEVVGLRSRQFVVNVVRKRLAAVSAVNRPVPARDLAARLGIDVVDRDLTRFVSGLLVKHPQKGAVVYVSTWDRPERQELTVGHEIGHWILHPAGVYCDRVGAPRTPVEREATWAAIEIKMPEALVRRLYRDGASEAEMAGALGVSLEAVRIRLKELRLIHPGNGWGGLVEPLIAF